MPQTKTDEMTKRKRGGRTATIISHKVAGVAAALLILGTLSRTLAYADPGDLDPTFGGGTGMVTTDFGVGEMANALVLQPDGKLVAAGSSGTCIPPVSCNFDFALARYNPDGSLDPTFGGGTGMVTTDFGGNERANAVVLQPDGKLVAAGFSHAGDPGNFALARYNSDGSPDLTFGTDGMVTTDFGGYIDEAHALVLQPDGKLVVAGFSIPVSGTQDFALARYNPDGSLDPTFSGGTGGRVTTDFGGNERANAVVLQPDGKLVAAGEIEVTGAGDFALARYNPDGSLDPTFGGGTGMVTTDFDSDEHADALILQPDGKLVVAGQTGVPGAHDFALARYNPDGSLDPTFGGGTGGRVTTDFGANEHADALILQPDGKLVAAGSWELTDDFEDFALARYNPDGTLDLTFGGGTGKVTTDVGAGEEADALILQPDGKLVAAGYSSAPGTRDFAMARYLGDPPPTGPDLTGSWQSLTQSCKGEGVEQKCKLKGKVRVQNLGTEKAPTSSFLQFYLSTDPVLDGADSLLRQVTISALKPGKAKSKKLKYKFPTSLTASGQYVIAVLDATGLIAEQDETNNVLVFGPIP